LFLCRVGCVPSRGLEEENVSGKKAVGENETVLSAGRSHGGCSSRSPGPDPFVNPASLEHAFYYILYSSSAEMPTLLRSRPFTGQRKAAQGSC